MRNQACVWFTREEITHVLGGDGQGDGWSQCDSIRMCFSLCIVCCTHRPFPVQIWP